VKILAVVAIAVLSACLAGAEETELGDAWKEFFPKGATLTKVDGLKKNDKAYQVTGPEGEPSGWVFRTDRMAPRVRGFSDQIGILIAVSPELRIVGMKVLRSRETPGYFRRLRSTFFKQFEHHPVTHLHENVEAVSGATISSTAIIRDVSRSTTNLLGQLDLLDRVLDSKGKPAAEKK